MHIKWNVATCAYSCAHCADRYLIWIATNRSYVLGSHEHLPVQMDLSTAETDVSSVGNNLTQIERWCGAGAQQSSQARTVMLNPMQQHWLARTPLVDSNSSGNSMHARKKSRHHHLPLLQAPSPITIT